MTILTSKSNVVGAGSDESDRRWQAQIKSAIRDLHQLCELLELPEEFRADISAVSKFPVFVTPSYLARIEKGRPNDPLLRQVLPLVDEDQPVPGFAQDPLQEQNFSPTPGLLHKYPNRALMVVTGACAIHCRYCFRRHFPYQDAPHSAEDWRPALAAISEDTQINEVLLSGGDPLMLVDSRIAELINELESISHLKRIRIHTRLPIMVPERITKKLLEIVQRTRLQTIVVIHSNHANELDKSVALALEQLRSAGTMLLNQSVLLRGINDQPDTLKRLSERLVECNVMPYYLHQLDRVAGAAHFEVDIDVGKALIASLRAQLPGYAVPRYVQEIPGESSKVILA